MDAAHAGTPLTLSKAWIHDLDEGLWQTRRKKQAFNKHDILLAIEDQEILNAAQLKNYLIERTTASVRQAKFDGSMRSQVYCHTFGG